MNLFEIIGPVMVGPSSSHTAGAVRIGRLARKLMHQDIASAVIQLHGSFRATGHGHGTDRALLAGLLGMDCDDERIPQAFEIAREKNLDYRIEGCDLGVDAHPNSVRMYLHGVKGKDLEMVAASIGGGQIEVHEIDGLKCVFSGDYPALIAENDDRPGMVAQVTELLAERGINIATVQLDRDARHGHAVTVIETDSEIAKEDIETLRKIPGFVKITYLSLEDD
jgi:L-serine dehydratase